MAKRIYTKKLGRAVAASTRASHIGVPDKYHVISRTGKWSVVPSGNLRATRVFSTKFEAVAFAKRTARKITGEVIVHDKTGQIKETISYNN